MNKIPRRAAGALTASAIAAIAVPTAAHANSTVSPAVDNGHKVVTASKGNTAQPQFWKAAAAAVGTAAASRVAMAAVEGATLADAAAVAGGAVAESTWVTVTSIALAQPTDSTNNQVLTDSQFDVTH